jgi:hypothetical protein
MAGACLGLAACGGSSSNNPSGELSGRKAAEQKMVKFAKCLREHGIDAQTGGPGGKGFGININPGPGEGKPGPSGPSPQFLAAQRACKRYQPPSPLQSMSPAERAQQRQKTAEFARCMRSHGVAIPDPGPSGVLEFNGIDPRSAAFQTAQQACQRLMGKAPLAMKARFGPGPGGPGGKQGSESESERATAPAGGGGK